MPSLMMMTVTVSEESLSRDRHTGRCTHTLGRLYSFFSKWLMTLKTEKVVFIHRPLKTNKKVVFIHYQCESIKILISDT